MSQLDQHLTTEQISSYLDNQLLPTETLEDYRAHFQVCEQCQHGLDELRQTARMLQALPQPALPRSFLLPADFSRKDHEQERGLPQPVPLRRSSTTITRKRIPTTLRRTLRVASTLVALVGVLFVLSGLINYREQNGSAASSASGSSKAASSADTNSSLVTPTTSKASQQSEHKPGVNPEARAKETPTTQAATSTPPAYNKAQTAKPTNQVQQPRYLPILLFFDLSAPAGRLGLGIILFIIGLMGFTLFKQRKRSLMQEV